MRTCRVCELSKPEADFQHKKGKPTNRCRECYADYQRNYYEKNREAQRARTRAYKKENALKIRASRFNISVEELETILDRKVCDICKIKDITAIDHDHETGMVRGGLCSGCNSGLGLLGDTLESVERAAEYLRGYRSRLISEGL